MARVPPRKWRRFVASASGLLSLTTRVVCWCRIYNTPLLHIKWIKTGLELDDTRRLYDIMNVMRALGILNSVKERGGFEWSGYSRIQSLEQQQRRLKSYKREKKATLEMITREIACFMMMHHTHIPIKPIHLFNALDYHKKKQRRIYDVCSIMCGLNVMEKTHNGYKWVFQKKRKRV